MYGLNDPGPTTPHVPEPELLRPDDPLPEEPDDGLAEAAEVAGIGDRCGTIHNVPQALRSVGENVP